MTLSPADHDRIAAAVARAEAGTSGEIFCILSTRRPAYAETAVAVAAIAAFALPMLGVLAGLAPWTVLADWAAEAPSPVRIVELFLAMQVVVFTATLALVALTGVAPALTPAAWARRGLHRLAREQFLAKGLHETEGRTGVLLFACITERYAEVVADEGIYAKVAPDHWGDTVAALIAGARDGDIAGGFERAIALAGAVLGEHFPPGALNPNELTDRLVEI